MSVTVLSAPEVRPDRLENPAETVVTITVQITLAGDELPAVATRLISDLEALVGGQPPAGMTLAGGNPPSSTSEPSGTPAPQRAATIQSGPALSGQSAVRALRLVGPSSGRADESAQSVVTSDPPQIRRIGQPHASALSLFLHTGSRLLVRDGVPLQLTRREYDLFQFFCANPRRVFTRSQLLRQVWGYDMVGTERTVDVHVRRLRVKLGACAAIITTVRGVGYRLDDDAPVEIVVQED